MHVQAFYRELNAKFRPRLLSYLDTDDATSAQALKARLVTGLRTMKARVMALALAAIQNCACPILVIVQVCCCHAIVTASIMPCRLAGTS
jgi:hypothetical protein